MATHYARGRRIVYVDDGHIVAAQLQADQSEFEERIKLARIPITRNGTIGFQVENAMAAVAAAWALKVDWHTIRDACNSFVNDAKTAPGRFNLFDYRGASVIADYGHNPDAMLALVAAVETMPAKKRMVVISGAGDRRDDDISRQTEILGSVFDEIILYQDQCQRGRADGEVLKLLQRGLVNAKCTKKIDEIQGEFIAIDTALARLQAGDLCLILIDQVDEALAHIAQRVAS
jgi:cyanophycin synthetase